MYDAADVEMSALRLLLSRRDPGRRRPLRLWELSSSSSLGGTRVSLATSGVLKASMRMAT